MKINFKTQFILDLSVAGLFVVFCMISLINILPLGFTRSFLVGGYKAVSLISIILMFLFLFAWFLNKDFKFKKKISFPNLKDLFLLILPLSPILNYILVNPEYLTPNGVIYIIGITLVFCLIVCFILPIIFSYIASLNILVISGIALCFTIFSMPKIIIGNFLFDDLFFTQGIYLITSFSLVYLLYLFDKKLTYLTIILFMFAGITNSFLNGYLNITKNSKTEILNSDRLIKFLNNKDNQIINKKNIYILVYESYANLETIDHYGFDNREHMKFLEIKGFKNYHGIYSNGAASESSTAKILDINGKLYPSHDGPKSWLYLPYLSGNAFATEILKSNGYKTTGLYPHGFFWVKPLGWDEHQPKEISGDIGGKILTKSIFEGYFRHDAFTDYFDYDDFLNSKRKYLTSKKKNNFFYSQNKYPGHSGHSSKCGSEDKNLYFEGLKKANLEMKHDVTNILANDPNSIIVLVGDHGPYLTKNCSGLQNFYKKSEIDKYDIQDRYGTFLSIHWPKDIKNVNQNIQMAQDIFPAILSRITNNNGLFDELKVERRFFWDWEVNWSVGGVNVENGIIKGGKDDGKPLFEKRTYYLEK